MAKYAAGDLVLVMLSGRLGHVIGLSDNPAYVGNDEPVYQVRYDDDGTTVNAGESSLATGGESAPEPVAEAAPAAPEATSDDPVQ
ncbi:MAG TPA: hypothetical protein VGR57_12165 [Ktedonobacterales bacterium]|nr:hypothetical protein [Ktedonobacterales bacterium]